LIRKWDEILITQKGKKADDKSENEQGKCDSIETDATCFHRGDLTISGEHAEDKEGREQNSIGKGPLKDHFWDLVKEVHKYQIKGSPIFNDKIYLLEEEDNDINEDHAAQG
jgi:hypothetical protein